MSVICSNHISKYPVQREHWGGDDEETLHLFSCHRRSRPWIAGAASAGEYKNADALSVAQGKPKRTDCSIKEDVDTKTYCFGDEAAKSEFMKDAKANVAKADTYWQPCKEGIAEYMHCD
jgi:hypothetical protein